MAEYQTARAGVGTRAAEIHEGLRAHMNKVYGTMSIGMLLTFAVAWAVGTTPDCSASSAIRHTAANILGWIACLRPLIMVFAFGAMINRLSAAGAQMFFYAFASVMGLSIAWIFVAFTGFSIAQVFLVTRSPSPASRFGAIRRRKTSRAGDRS